MANAWFESVAEAQRRAKKRLPKGVYGALVAGSERGLTVEDNLAAFAELGFAPHTAGPGQRAGHGRHRHGPADVDAGPDQPDRRAGGAPRRRGRGRPRRRGPRRGDGALLVREQADRGGRRGQPADLLPDVLGRHPRGDAGPHGARPAGRRGGPDRHPRLVVLLRPRLGQPVHPGEDRLRGGPPVRPAGGCSSRAGCSDFARTGQLPDLTVPNMVATPGEPAPTFFGAYGMWMQSPMPTWEDVAWLREQWDGPFMLKGVMRVDDAQRAVDAGVTAISVSNHGGNNLDGTPASIRALPAVAEAVGDQVEVLLDGGIRRGGDVAKALALGAKAVHDRPRLPVGPGRQRPGRRGERARPAARRARLGHGRPRPPLGHRAQPRRPGRPARLRAAPGHDGGRPTRC